MDKVTDIRSRIKAIDEEPVFTPEDKKLISTFEPVVVSDQGYFRLPYYKDSKFFLNNIDDNFYEFIKATQKIIRNSDIYTSYINYLKEEIGLNHCMLLSNIDDEMATIEMHHGPVLNLYDYCSIILEHLLKKGLKVNTFELANQVMKEHFLNNVQIVMLTTTMHQLAHTRKIFIHPKMCWGNIVEFLKRYGEGVNQTQTERINSYVRQCVEYNEGSRTRGYLILNDDYQKLEIEEEEK